MTAALLPFAPTGPGAAERAAERRARLGGGLVVEMPRRARVSPHDWAEPGPEDARRVVQVRYTEACGPDPDVEARRAAGHPSAGACRASTLYGPSPVRAMATIVRRLDVLPGRLTVDVLHAASETLGLFIAETDLDTGETRRECLAVIDRGLTLAEAQAGLVTLQRKEA